MTVIIGSGSNPIINGLWTIKFKNTSYYPKSGLIAFIGNTITGSDGVNKFQGVWEERDGNFISDVKVFELSPAGKVSKSVIIELHIKGTLSLKYISTTFEALGYLKGQDEPIVDLFLRRIGDL